MLEELELIKNLFRDLKVKKYLKLVTKKHPEIDNYGVNCDAQLWADFNKELRIREIAKEERSTLQNMLMFLGSPIATQEPDDNGLIFEDERNYALAKLSVLIESNKVDRFTFLKK